MGGSVAIHVFIARRRLGWGGFLLRRPFLLVEDRLLKAHGVVEDGAVERRNEITIQVGGIGFAAQAGQDAAAADRAGGVSVAGAVVTTSVEDHMPVDTLSTVPADVGRAFLWTRITGAADSTTVVHVWYRGEEEEARVDLPVHGSDWRTYSTKRILPSWTGPWRVEVRDVDGQVLETVSFTVGSAGGGA